MLDTQTKDLYTYAWKKNLSFLLIMIHGRNSPEISIMKA